MSRCVGCGRQFPNAVLPIHCSCGVTTAAEHVATLANHWIALHAYPVDNWNTWSTGEAEKWYEAWCEAIPSYGCGCKAKWERITERRPVDLTGPREFFVWAWARHNDVSAILGKAPISLCDAAVAHHCHQILSRQSISHS